MPYVITYVGAVVTLFAIDMVWLSLVAVTFYKTHLGYLLRATPLWPAAVAFYLFYVVGILYFASYPAVQSGGWLRALLTGALFGALAYATYDLSNFATVKDWPLIVVVVDIAWGVVLTSVVSTVGYFIARMFV